MDHEVVFASDVPDCSSLRANVQVVMHARFVAEITRLHAIQVCGGRTVRELIDCDRIRRHTGRRGLVPEVVVPKKNQIANKLKPQQAHRGVLKKFIDNEISQQVHHDPVQGKGFDMLMKMGWKPGQALGQYEQGIIEPVAANGKRTLNNYGISYQPLTDGQIDR